MGINFYCIRLEAVSCNCCFCDRIHYQEKKYHIGKSSAGWVFAVAQAPDLEIYSWEDWREFFSSYKYEGIENECGDKVTVKEMIAYVEERCSQTREHHDEETLRKWIQDEYGRPLALGLHYEQNNPYRNNWRNMRGPLPLPGPRGLLRRPLLEGHCVAHGTGTWDVIEGEFS